MKPALALALALAVNSAAAACRGGARGSDAGAPDEVDPAEIHLVDLEKDEAAWRASTDWASFPASDAALGPDPIDLVALGDGRYAGVLRGANAVVLLDAEGRELDRAPAPRAPRSLAVDGSNAPGLELVIAGELDAALGKVRVDQHGFTSQGRASALPGAFGARGVAVGHGVHAVDVDGRLLSFADARVRPQDARVREVGPFALTPRIAGAWLGVMSVLGHRVVLSRVAHTSSDVRGARGHAEDGATARHNSKPALRHDVPASICAVAHECASLVSDGPPFGFALRAVGEDALVAVGMIEDHPLDRTGGSFGFIDSFLRVQRVSAAGEVARVLEVNLSEHGVVTPKALAFIDDDTVLVAGSGSGRAARVTLSTGAVVIVPSLPGVVALVPTAHGFIGASPLLDAWVIVDERGARAVPVASSGPNATSRASGSVAHGTALEANARSVDSKLGEALAFTTIMAPRQKSDGALSRFTCEACHFEGFVDGRTHDTGRMSSEIAKPAAGASVGGSLVGDAGPVVHESAAPEALGADAQTAQATDEHVRATTKPLWGLFNNKPLFTRAMDANLSRMVHAEFRVANANSALDPWFALTPADAAWLSLLGVEGTRSPVELRRALVAFLRDFTPRTNPRVLRGRPAPHAFSALERRGAEVFRARCASCHAARLVGDDATSEQPFETWEALVLRDNGPLVWSSAEHQKTGIEPYVHEDGARASSLRRVWLKAPLFTNGAARTLADALELVRLSPDGTILHASKRDLPGLADDEKRALHAFLLLL